MRMKQLLGKDRLGRIILVCPLSNVSIAFVEKDNHHA